MFRSVDEELDELPREALRLLSNRSNYPRVDPKAEATRVSRPRPELPKASAAGLCLIQNFIRNRIGRTCKG
jgi:hypothetical protein